METKTIIYTIMLQPPKAAIQTFSITFSNDNTPKDKYDHQDAIIDYLVDTNPNPFATVPDFEIITIEDK